MEIKKKKKENSIVACKSFLTKKKQIVQEVFQSQAERY